MAINTNTNSYTFLYAVIMTLLVAIILAGVSTALKPMQDMEKALDKKNAILNAVIQVDKTEADAKYAKSIKELVLDSKGNEIKGVNAFDIQLKKEYRKPESERQLPLYLFSEGSKSIYILPLFGSGLWDEIWGFVALDKDLNTVVGSSFDHKGETPGLGAEIAVSWFMDQFKGKKFLDNSGAYQFKILKGKGNNLSSPHHVDGISGATITGDGVADMLEKGYKSYSNFFNKQKGIPQP